MANHLAFQENLTPSAAKGMAFDPERLEEDFRQDVSAYRDFWVKVPHAPLPVERFGEFSQVWLDVGAGSGGFFQAVARYQPDTLCLAIERDRMRGKALEKRTRNLGPDNFVGVRGNIIPMAVQAFPEASLDRIFFLYPCPWPKYAHRKNRWYQHPIMAPLFSALKPGGLLVWASDQEFYLREAHYLFERHYPVEVLHWGAITPHPENLLDAFPGGRTNFERDFLQAGKPCWELVLRKTSLN